MTAFAVYGVLFHECLSTAKKNTPATIKKGDKVVPLSQQEWLVEVEKRAEKQFKTAKPKKFAKVESPHRVWCEVQAADLHMMERTK